MDVQDSLEALGFHWTGTALHDSIVRFQTAYCGPPVGNNHTGWLAIDGIAGPATNDALSWTMGNKQRLSTNFVASETWCKHCHKNFVRRELLSALEILRVIKGNHPLAVLDMCRCPDHNRDIGGAPDSQHQYGSAFDVSTPITRHDLDACHRWSGIGWRPNENPCHADVRHIFGNSPLNPTRSTIDNPAVFKE